MMDFLIPDDLTIPDFLKREMPAGWIKPTGSNSAPTRHEEARERHRARLRRRAEKMRDRKQTGM
jgi:hypothetical protein